MLTDQEQQDMYDCKEICANLLGQGPLFEVNTISREVNPLLDIIAGLCNKQIIMWGGLPTLTRGEGYCLEHDMRNRAKMET